MAVPFCDPPGPLLLLKHKTDAFHVAPSTRRLEMALTISGVTDSPNGILKTKYRRKTILKLQVQ